MSDTPEIEKGTEVAKDDTQERRFSDIASELWNDTIEHVTMNLQYSLKPLQDPELSRKPSELYHIRDMVQASALHLQELLKLHEQAVKAHHELKEKAPHQPVSNPLYEHQSDS